MNNPRVEMNTRPRIAITVPYLYSVRDLLFTPVWHEIVTRQDVDFLLLCSNPEIADLVSKRDCSNVASVQFPPSTSSGGSFVRRLLRLDMVPYTWVKMFRVFDAQYVFDSVGYRFAAVSNLSHYRIRKEKSAEERRRQRVFFDYRGGEIVGYPFPRSRTMFRLLYELRHSFLNHALKEDVSLVEDLRPDLFVFGRLHHPATPYWARILRGLAIPMMGIVPSWDHPTTKGPTPRGMSGYVVASRRMVEEMRGLHGLAPEKLCQVGKVQMDAYSDPSIFERREDFLRRMGLPTDHKLVTFGTNTTGLKEHEVSIAQKLSKDFANGCYGKATLLLRTHPQDVNWERDFLSLARRPGVACLDACSFGNRPADSMSRGGDDVVLLANLMKHSDVVIQSRGSLALDAIAFDTPVVSLAFDGHLVRSPKDSFLLEYGFEHYKPLVAAQGTWMVGSYEALDQAMRGYLGDPAIHSEGRKIIREEHIEPLDGKASRRLVDYLVDSARREREGMLPGGDWDYTGLGDVTWSSGQTCNVQDYVQQ